MTRRSLFSTFLGTLLAPIAAKFFPPPPKPRWLLLSFGGPSPTSRLFGTYAEALAAIDSSADYALADLAPSPKYIFRQAKP